MGIISNKTLKMAPNLLGTSALFLAEATTTKDSVERVGHQQQNGSLTSTPYRSKQNRKDVPYYRWEIVWRNVFGFIYLHGGSLYGLYLMFTVCKWQTNVWGILVGVIASQGITAGAHRLWAHKTYKANLPLRIFLMLLQTLAFQNHIYEWVRDHRVHHKFTDTDADPHNAKRGFFFSHIGWLMVKKHKDVKDKGKTVDMSDLEDDVVVTFQRKYYLILMPIFCFVIPTLVPWYFWAENLSAAWYTAGIFRYTFSLNCTWLVNSAAHIWGTKPYDKSIGPTENVHVAFWAFGEGWHNYHHVFPWDYKAAELGNYKLNLTTMMIDWWSRMGWTWDLKTASVEMVKKRVKRTGDGTRVFPDDIQNHDHDDHSHTEGLWGWGDKDMTEEQIKDVQIFNNLKSC